MIQNNSKEVRKLKQVNLETDLAVIGGGLAGVCTAITAARQGLKVVLIQDRPVLGGNASSEVRLWILGATSHMGNNNRWAREGGVVDELMVENMYRNKEGNPVIFDSILLDKVISEPNITLLLNTAVYEVTKKDADTIAGVTGFCSQNQTTYTVNAPLFCDSSGDGIVGFLSGAAFRMGAESKEEFGEKFAPSKEYGELLGHSLYFYSKDVGKPVKYTPPSFALDDITTIPRFKSFNAKDFGCRLWWIEYGGRLDTIADTETIKWELWKVVYGVWNHIKNSGNFPEAENLTLEWVGTIPGKRESRRFEGDYMLTQQDIVEQRTHEDAVAFGGWSIDLHPADGVFSEKPGCNQWHSKGIYQIPYRTLYSRNIKNLFISGRLISATHVAFGSTRVMATSAYVGQSIAVAAKICKEHNLQPSQLISEGLIGVLQSQLLSTGQYIPGYTLKNTNDLVSTASLSATSELLLNELPFKEELIKRLNNSVGQMIPLVKGKVPTMIIHAHSEISTSLKVQLRLSGKLGNHTPDEIVETIEVAIHPNRNCISLSFTTEIEIAQYGFLTILKNPDVSLYYSDWRITGLLSVFNSINPAVSNYGKQEPKEDIGVDAFEFWCPKRRPEGHNIALKLAEPINLFTVENIRNGIDRPVNAPNAWVADLGDTNPAITINWDKQQTIQSIDLFFDADYDHPMESVLMGHPENVMPFVVRDYTIKDDAGNTLYSKKGNYQTINKVEFSEPVTTTSLTIEVAHPSSTTPAAVFAIRAF